MADQALTARELSEIVHQIVDSGRPTSLPKEFVRPSRGGFA